MQLVERFHLEDMYNKSENFIFMLYYIGILTIKEWILNKTVLGIPNYVIRKIYWEYFMESLSSGIGIDKEAVSSSIRLMGEQGDMSLFTDELKKMAVLSNRDLMSFSEKSVKLLICYAKYTKFEWLIELKYLKESERGKLEEVKQAGRAQLTRYSDSELVARSFSGGSLKKLLLIVVGKTEIYTDEL